MRHFRFLVVLTLVFAWTLAAGQPASAQGKAEKVQELLAITQTESLLQSLLPALLQQQRQAMSRLRPDIPDKVWTKVLAVAEEAFRESLKDFIEAIVPIYERNFSEEEIDGMLTFYRTPVGRSVVKKLPRVTQESMIAGQQWGMAVGQEVHRRMVEELAEAGYQI